MVCIFYDAKTSTLIFDFVRRKPDKELPGDITGGETPVPIPNTEAKPVGPMVVFRGESRSSPGFFLRADSQNESALSFFMNTD